MPSSAATILEHLQQQPDAPFGLQFMKVATPKRVADLLQSPECALTTDDVYDTGSDGGSEPPGDAPDDDEVGPNPNNGVIPPECADDWYKDDD